MERRLYKLNLDRVHFGSGSLDSAGASLTAGQLFSALCIEALKLNGDGLLQQLVAAAKADKLGISDAMPYSGSTYFLPKPIMANERSAQQLNDRALGDAGDRKLLKGIKYMPLASTREFLAGNANLDDVAKQQAQIGSTSVVAKVAVRTGDKTEPYRVGTFSFAPESGLYIVAQADAAGLETLDSLIASLAHTGIGGKRSAGLGRFESSVEILPAALNEMLDDAATASRIMTLATCLPSDAELTDDLLDGATYLLTKRSGFVYSETYTSQLVRKQNLYTFAAGSVFAQPFNGDVFDVSAGQGSHPVWAYAKPLFIGIDTAGEV